MAFTLPDLPFDRQALEPHMSGETLDYHHGKHHKAYVDKVNAAVAEKALGGASLSQVIRAAAEQGDTGLFDNAGQFWNHNFFWQCLAPPAGQRPTGKLAELIDAAFGSTDRMLAKLKEGSGRPFRQRLGLAGPRRRRAEDRLAPRRRHPGRA
ncbi:MAG: superoxide dismutase [Alphaproteobacteria bacterium]|nr:superoxide dismutase [Alphaproteobacteria bacterium]